jgi:hypothetical protein
MNEPITFTMNDLVHLIGAISGLLVAINAGIVILITWYKKAHAPEEKQNERLDALEEHVENLQKAHVNLAENVQYQVRRLETREKDLITFEKLTIKSLQALSKHAIDGNNLSGLKEASAEMDDYLLEQM